MPFAEAVRSVSLQVTVREENSSRRASPRAAASQILWTGPVDARQAEISSAKFSGHLVSTEATPTLDTGGLSSLSTSAGSPVGFVLLKA